MKLTSKQACDVEALADYLIDDKEFDDFVDSLMEYGVEIAPNMTEDELDRFAAFNEMSPRSDADNQELDALTSKACQESNHIYAVAWRTQQLFE